MTEYRTLDTVPLKAVHECFVAAFSDYFVKISPTLEEFERMNALRGVDYSASLGAFEEGELAGFTLNGVGSWRGRAAAYDAGTAVLKSFRGRGFSKEIFRRLLPTLKARGLRTWLLEVIDGNAGAYKLYSGLGFAVKRRLVCMKLAPGALRAEAGGGIAVSDVPPGAWPELRAAMERDDPFLPSWQNSWDSVGRLPGGFAVKAVLRGSAVEGYGIVAPQSGSVPQLWVKSSCRGRGTGSALLAALAGASRSGGLSWLNIDGAAAGTLKFLSSRGFERGLSQYEMELGL